MRVVAVLFLPRQVEKNWFYIVLNNYNDLKTARPLGERVATTFCSGEIQNLIGLYLR